MKYPHHTLGTSRLEEKHNTDFESLLEEYRAIELRVEVLMNLACAPHCSVCPTPCCRIAICREAAQSPFLLAVHGSKQPFDAKRGYLGATGCKLGAGRPPVCHAYVCERILSHQASDQRRFALECLGDLIGYMGKQLWLKRHLVEALSDGDLLKVNHTSFRSRLAESAQALGILESYFISDQDFDETEIASLGLIRKPAFNLP